MGCDVKCFSNFVLALIMVNTVNHSILIEDVKDKINRLFSHLFAVSLEDI